jgi:hypothetical protein
MLDSARKSSRLQLLILVILVSSLVLLGISNVGASSSSTAGDKLYGGALDDAAIAIVQTDYPLASGIYIKSPSNSTYNIPLLTLNVSVTALVFRNLGFSMTYSLDGMNKNTIPLMIHPRENSFQAIITGEVNLPTLSYGSHNVTVFAEYTINNEVSRLDNSTVYFTVDTNLESEIPEFPSSAPLLIILLPVTITAIIYRRSIRKHNRGRT